jgi:hypothetical protein
MKYILLIISIVSFNAIFAQDSTIAQIKNPLFHKQRDAIFARFRPIRDSLIKSQPFWHDSIFMYSWDTTLETRIKVDYFKTELRNEREQVRKIWIPFSVELIALDRKYRVVGDMKAQSFFIYDNQ